MNKILEAVPLLYYDITGVLAFLLLYFGFRKKSDHIKMRALYILCIINFIAYVIKAYCFYPDDMLNLN